MDDDNENDDDDEDDDDDGHGASSSGEDYFDPDEAFNDSLHLGSLQLKLLYVYGTKMNIHPQPETHQQQQQPQNSQRESKDNHSSSGAHLPTLAMSMPPVSYGIREKRSEDDEEEEEQEEDEEEKPFEGISDRPLLRRQSQLKWPISPQSLLTILQNKEKSALSIHATNDNNNEDNSSSNNNVTGAFGGGGVNKLANIVHMSGTKKVSFKPSTLPLLEEKPKIPA